MVKFRLLYALPLIGFFTQALHVIQWQDNMILTNNQFLDVSNTNLASTIANKQPPQMHQTFKLDLVSQLKILTRT